LNLRCVIFAAAIAAIGCSSPPSSGGPDTGVTPCTAANNFCADAGGNNPDASSGLDASPGIDSGSGLDASTGVDSGSGLDASSGLDSGSGLDASTGIDASTPPDAGATVDAGVPLCVWDQGNWDQCLWQ
jgi:26S proteasome regulatory subunit N2